MDKQEANEFLNHLQFKGYIDQITLLDIEIELKEYFEL